MIPYVGLPITPAPVAVAAVEWGHAFVSFAHPEQLDLAVEVCQSIALDNGAFSAWTKGKPVTDWSPYYEWVAALHRDPVFDFAVIPDVIDGDEEANDALLAEWPWRDRAPWIGAPVWHLHESLERLERLALRYPRVCLGSSGQFAKIGTSAWWNRMAEAFNVICDREGRPVCKVHGLRMLDPEVFTRFPFASADSTNIGRNVGIDSNWRHAYPLPDKEWRARAMRARLEPNQSPRRWVRQPITQSLLEAA